MGLPKILVLIMPSPQAAAADDGAASALAPVELDDVIGAALESMRGLALARPNQNRALVSTAPALNAIG